MTDIKLDPPSSNPRADLPEIARTDPPSSPPYPICEQRKKTVINSEPPLVWALSGARQTGRARRSSQAGRVDLHKLDKGTEEFSPLASLLCGQLEAGNSSLAVVSRVWTRKM